MNSLYMIHINMTTKDENNATDNEIKILFYFSN